MFKHCAYGTAGLLALTLSANALADDPTPDAKPSILTLSGFGTVGAVQTNTDDGVYTTGFQRHGATKTSDFGPDTKAGAQVDAKFNSDFSATLQVFSKQNAKGSYAPAMEWAFGKLKVNDAFNVRVGRIGAPLFMTSDFRNVGYTNLTVRTPVDVYGLVPVRSFDGADVLYSGSFGNTTINGQVWGGKASTLIGGSGENDNIVLLKNIIGINVTLENGPFTVRIGSNKSHLGTDGTGLIPFNTLLGGLHAFSAAPGLSQLGSIADQLSVNGKFASFTGIGATFDSGNWVASAEAVERRTSSTYVSNASAWYTTLGYRIDKFTPYVSFSGRHIKSATSVAQVPVSPLLPPVVQGTVPVLIAGVNGLLRDTSEKTSALGVRWDAGKNYDIKAEVQKLTIPSGSDGALNQVTGHPPVGNTNLFSLAVDFVF
ncbi:hypothetical protein [Sapientia aquatica]|uniref:Porin n=1 Tax=Sapientia aquatica TaxID=1549640 RepID=A0A4V6PMK7_9BURK|nr:hypothetical protein [Sapientia aquatica]TDK68566.1 hypothetical protein E2I14_03225 [Sapientia aquatica]